MGFLDYDGLKYVYSKILTRFKNITSSITSITNGTTKVGNADKLDGNDSSYFATATDMETAISKCVQSGGDSLLNSISINKLVAIAQTDTEGGEITLEKPPTSDLSANVLVDINTNLLRFFEGGGSARGAVIDLTACEAGAGTRILHTGISYGVVLSTTAPNDIKALWVDTSHKCIYAFIDGAWAAVASL